MLSCRVLSCPVRAGGVTEKNPSVVPALGWDILRDRDDSAVPRVSNVK